MRVSIGGLERVACNQLKYFEVAPSRARAPIACTLLVIARRCVTERARTPRLRQGLLQEQPNVAFPRGAQIRGAWSRNAAACMRRQHFRRYCNVHVVCVNSIVILVPPDPLFEPKAIKINRFARQVPVPREAALLPPKIYASTADAFTAATCDVLGHATGATRIKAASWCGSKPL